MGMCVLAPRLSTWLPAVLTSQGTDRVGPSAVKEFFFLYITSAVSGMTWFLKDEAGADRLEGGPLEEEMLQSLIDRSRAPPSDRLDLQLAALRATSCLPSAFVNKVLSAHGHTHSLTHGRFLLNSRVESLQHRPQGWKHLLAGPLRKSLLNPGLEADVLSGAEVARTEPLSYTV